MADLTELKKRYYNLIAKAVRTEADKKNILILRDTIETLEKNNKIINNIRS